MPRFITVEIVSKSAAYVSGHGARELIVECGAKSPMWMPRRHAWATSAKIASDVLALCDMRNLPVRMIEAVGE